MNIVDRDGLLSHDAHQALGMIVDRFDPTPCISIHGTYGSARVAGLPGLYQLDVQRDEIVLVLSHVTQYAKYLAGTPASAYWGTLVHATASAICAYWVAIPRPGTAYAAPIDSPDWDRSARPIVDRWLDEAIGRLLVGSPTLWQPLQLGPYFDGLLTAEIGRLERRIARMGPTAPGIGPAYGELLSLYASSRQIVQLSRRELESGLGIDLRDRAAMARLDLAIARRGAGIRVSIANRNFTFFTFGDLVALRADLGQWSIAPAIVGDGCLVRAVRPTAPPTGSVVSTVNSSSRWRRTGSNRQP